MQLTHSINPVKIEQDRLYQDMGLSDEEFEKKSKRSLAASRILRRPESFRLCGQSIAATKRLNRS